MILLAHSPNFIMDYSGACLVVDKLIESMSCPLYFSRKDIFRIFINYRDYWGFLELFWGVPLNVHIPHNLIVSIFDIFCSFVV